MPHGLNPYESNQARERALTERLLEQHPFKTFGRFVCYEVSGGHQCADIGRSVEGEVFRAVFNDTPQEMKIEYGPYEGQSTFFLSVDRKLRRAAGVLRVINYGENGFKTLNDLSHLVSHREVLDQHDIARLDDCYDMGTVAIRKVYRGNLSSAAQLYRAAQLSAERVGVKHYIAALDHRAYDRLVSYVGAPFVPLARLGRVKYMGSSETQPAFMNLDDVMSSLWRKIFTPKGAVAWRVSIPQMLGTLDHTIYKAQVKQ